MIGGTAFRSFVEPPSMLIRRPRTDNAAPTMRGRRAALSQRHAHRPIAFALRLDFRGDLRHAPERRSRETVHYSCTLHFSRPASRLGMAAWHRCPKYAAQFH